MIIKSSNQRCINYLIYILFFLFLFGCSYFQIEEESENIFTAPYQFSEKNQDEYTVLTSNVGNSNLLCRKYNWKLCQRSVEEKISRNIKILSPDIVALQEVVPDWLCESLEETNPRKVCKYPNKSPQIRRLLGPDYTIVCESTHQYDCLGVKVGSGIIKGCETGEICLNSRSVDVPSDCDPGFNIFGITLELKNGSIFDLISVHPQSFNDDCRVILLKNVFTPENPDESIIKEEKVLVLGDFNFDPWRDDNRSSDLWEEILILGWGGVTFKYHSAIAEKIPPYPTFFFLLRKTLDFSVSNFADGNMVVLGRSPQTERLDGGVGTDHRAIFGKLKFPSN